MSRRLALTLLVALGLAAVAFGSDPKAMVGTWMGALDVPGGKLRIVVHITQAADGTLAATMDSLDQGAMGLKLDAVAVEGEVLRLELKMVGGSFAGTISADGKKVDGTWSQSGNSLPLLLERVDKVPELKRPQVPVKPYPYAEEEVSYENAPAGVKLAATFTYPKSGGPFPAVVLITGSGSEDRDETVFGHKPFLVLADSLTRHGIAVLQEIQPHEGRIARGGKSIKAGAESAPA